MRTEKNEQFLRALAKLLKEFNADLELNEGHGHSRSSINVCIRDEEDNIEEHFTLPNWMDGDF